MGCHSSKQARRDLQIHSPSPFRRTNSLSDNGNVVSLTFSTVGLLKYPPAAGVVLEQSVDKEEEQEEDDRITTKEEEEEEDLTTALAKARAWSSAIERKIPRTPTETPPCEPEPVDAWELMAGLSSPILSDRRSFSFYPMGGVADDNVEKIDDNHGKNNKKCDSAVIFYFTSLRGVRKTYDDCCSVRAILKEHGVRVDERDVSMHAGFKEELKELVPMRSGGGMLTLPRVFAGGRDLGGEVEVTRMHEEGELGRLLEGGTTTTTDHQEEYCEGCGDVRFVPCGRCSGSCRVFVDEMEDDEEEGGGRGWQRCSQCNENGIVRCPLCC